MKIAAANAEEEAKIKEREQAQLEDLEEGWLPMNAVGGEAEGPDTTSGEGVSALPAEDDMNRVMFLGTPEAMIAGLQQPLGKCSRAVVICPPVGAVGHLRLHAKSGGPCTEAQARSRFSKLVGRRCSPCADCQGRRQQEVNAAARHCHCGHWPVDAAGLANTPLHSVRLFLHAPGRSPLRCGRSAFLRVHGVTAGAKANFFCSETN